MFHLNTFKPSHSAHRGRAPSSPTRQPSTPRSASMHMPNHDPKRTLARVVVVISGVAIVLLLLSLGDGRTNPLRFVLNALSVVALGFNAYFLFKILRALGLYGRKGITAALGAVWLAIFAGAMAVLALLGFAEGAGGGSAGIPMGADWLGAL